MCGMCRGPRSGREISCGSRAAFSLESVALLHLGRGRVCQPVIPRWPARAPFQEHCVWAEQGAHGRFQGEEVDC